MSAKRYLNEVTERFEVGEFITTVDVAGSRMVYVGCKGVPGHAVHHHEESRVRVAGRSPVMVPYFW